jgi:hypothetical protein
MRKGWIIFIILIIVLGGLAFLYFYSPTITPKPSTIPTGTPIPISTNQTPQAYKNFYTGFLNGTLQGFFFSGITSDTYLGPFNGSFIGYGYINSNPVYMETKILSGEFNGKIVGEHKDSEFRGNILANIKNADMIGNITYLPVTAPEKLTFWGTLKKVWWIILLILVAIIIFWFILRYKSDDFEGHDIVEIDLSIRPILESEPFDKEIEKIIRSKPIPNSIKPQYHQILYKCRIPSGEYILVDAKYGKVLRIYTDIPATAILKNMDEIVYATGGEMPYYGGKRNYPYRRPTTRRTPPPTSGINPQGGEYRSP